MTPTHVLAIDLGSGGPKVALVSDAGRIVAASSARTATYFLPGDGVEQDAEEWWRVISEAARSLVGRALVPPSSIIGIACAAQWAVTVPVDRSGNVLGRAVHWMDARGARYTRRVTSGPIRVAGYGVGPLVRWLRLTGGIPPHSGADSLSHILFLKHERPDIYAAAHTFLEPMDYINFRLTGRMAASPASSFPLLLTDNRVVDRIEYAGELIRRAGIDRAKLPELLPAQSIVGTVRPEVAADWGIARQARVVSGLPDSQAAVLGSGAVADFAPHLCVGTSSWLTCHVPFKRTDIFRSLATMPSGVPGKNMVVGEQGPAGKCLEVFIEKWLAPASVGSDRTAGVYDELLGEASQVPPGSGGMLFLPWLNGAGPPLADSRARGGFLNQTLESNRAQAVRALLEGVAMNLRWLEESIERFVGRPFPELAYVGGGARGELWCQIMADVMKRTINQISEPTLAIARGAAFSAFMALGRIRLEEIPARVEVARRFVPRPEVSRIYDDLSREFRRAYRVNRRLFAALERFRGRSRPPLS